MALKNRICLRSKAIFSPKRVYYIFGCGIIEISPLKREAGPVLKKQDQFEDKGPDQLYF